MCLILLASCLRLFAEGSEVGLHLPGYVAPEEEAPSSLLSARVGEADVSLVASGSWRASVDGGVGLRIVPGVGVTFPASVAALASGLAFSQDPALSLAVHIEDRFFVEAGFYGTEADEGTSALLPSGLSYLAMGYAAKGDELLRSVTIGTRGVEMAAYPFLSVPGMGTSSFGAGAVLRSGLATHELLVRVDSLPDSSVVFIGMNQVEEERYAPAEYLRGRVFLLPDANVLDLSVLIEDSGGSFAGDDGRRYRPMSVEDGTASAAEGTVALSEEPEGCVLAWYQDSAARAVGDPALGRNALPAPSGDGIDQDAEGVDFAWEEVYLGEALSERAVTVGGRAYLRIWKRGEFSPFEVPSSYPLKLPAGTSAVSIRSVRRSSEVSYEGLPDDLDYASLPDEGRFVATLGLDARTNMRERFPFPDEEGLLYGPVYDAPEGSAELEILVRCLIPVDNYQVPAPVLAGSVRVTRNGLTETRFSVNEKTGVVELETPPAAGDVVEISYRTNGTESGLADVVLGWGNVIPVGEHAALKLAGGLLWGLDSGTYTDAPFTSTGGLVGSASISGSAELPLTARAREAGVRALLRYDASVGASVSQADTTGVRRLFGMEGSGAEVDLSEDGAWPSAVPADGEGLPADVDDSGRGKLTYRDYRSYDALGGETLLDYDTEDWPPADQIHAYVDGEVTGPYDVGGTSAGSSGRSLALDFEMEADEWWAGMQIAVSHGTGVEDLSWVEGIVCSLQAAASEGSYDVYVQIGALDEDLDGDGVLDKEASASSPGFSFDDASNGVGLIVGAGAKGTGNGVLDSEEIDGNGVLDSEEEQYVVTVGPTEAGEALRSTSAGAWATGISHFTSAERRRLTRARSLRVLVVKSSPGACVGRLLVDRLQLLGSAFWVHPEAEGTATVREVRETDLGTALQPAVPLEEAYEEVAARFHADASDQEVLEAGWQDLSPASLVIRGYLGTGSGGIDYRGLALYLRAPEIVLAVGAEEATVEVSLLDAEDRGITAGFALTAFEDWRRLEANADTGALSLGGSVPESASLTWDAGAGDLVELRIRVTGASSGRLYLDEVALTMPRAGIGAAGEAGVEIRLTGPVLSVGSATVISGLYARQRLVAYSGGFSPLFGRATTDATFRSTSEVGVETPIGAVEAFAGVDTSPSYTLVSGGHVLRLRRLLPARWPVHAAFGDEFSFNSTGSDPVLDHEVDLTLGWASLLTGTARLAVRADSGVLDQSWQGSIRWSSSPAPRVGLALALGKQATGYLPPGTWYGAWWADGLRGILPWTEGTDLWRKGKAEATLLIPTVPVGWELRALGSFSSTGTSSGTRRQETTFEYGMRLPLSFRPGGGAELSLVPSYGTKITLVSRVGETRLDFSDDLRELGAALSHHAWMLGFLPGADLLSPAALEYTVERLRDANDYPLAGALWSPSLSLELSRGVGSRLLDLVVPAYADVSFGRRVELEGELAEGETVLSAALKSSALNLFGRSGSRRVFSFYDRDELSTTATAEVAVPFDGSSAPSIDVGLASLVRLRSGKLFVAELENALDVEWGDETVVSDAGEARLSWLHREGIPVPRFLLGVVVGGAGKQTRFESSGALRHEERVGLDVEGPLGREGACVGVQVGHTSILEYPKLGALKAGVTIGVDFLRDDGIWCPGLGLEASVDIELRF